MNIEIEIYKTNGEIEAVSLANEKKGELLKGLQAIVGGYVEMIRYVAGVPIGEGKILLVNEDGLRDNLPPNPLIPGIVGNAVIMNDADFD